MHKSLMILALCLAICGAAGATSSIQEVKGNRAGGKAAGDNLDGFLNKIFRDIKEKTQFKNQVLETASKGPAIVPLLTAKLHDPAAAWQERWFSAMVLGQIGGETAKAELKKSLGDELFIIRLAAIKGLIQMNDLNCAADIRKLVSDPAMVVRSEVVATLGQWRDQSAVGALAAELHRDINFYNGRSLPVREKIIIALGQLGNPQAIPALIKELKRQEPPLQERALAALQSIAGNGKFKNAAPATGQNKEAWISWWEKEEKAVSGKS